MMEKHVCYNDHIHAPLSNKYEDACWCDGKIQNHPYGIYINSDKDGAWKGAWVDCPLWLKMKDENTWWK